MKYNLSLKKSDKLLNKKDFSEVFKRKKVFNTKKSIRIFYNIKDQKNHRIGLIVSKKISKKAVERNYMKRFLREWFRHNRLHLPCGDYIFFVKNKFDQSNRQEIDHELDNFKKGMQKNLL